MSATGSGAGPGNGTGRPRPDSAQRWVSAADGVNIAVVAGRLRAPAVLWVAPSGVAVVHLEVRVGTGAAAVTVPVAWSDPPAWGRSLDVDTAVVVVGSVRRRFFRRGATTVSRTEVAAGTVLVADGADRRRRALLRSVADRLEDAADRT